MLVGLTPAAALRLLGQHRELLDEALVPADCPPADHSPYRPEYGWLFCAERRLARLLEPWLPQARHALIGPGGVLSEALSNAFRHGNGRDPRLPIGVRVVAGPRGLLVRIQDRGRGFDAAAVAARLRRGQRYFEVAGSGFRAMEACPVFRVFFAAEGAAVHLLHLPSAAE